MTFWLRNRRKNKGEAAGCSLVDALDCLSRSLCKLSPLYLMSVCVYMGVLMTRSRLSTLVFAIFCGVFYSMHVACIALHATALLVADYNDISVLCL